MSVYLRPSVTDREDQRLSSIVVHLDSHLHPNVRTKREKERKRKVTKKEEDGRVIKRGYLVDPAVGDGPKPVLGT